MDIAKMREAGLIPFDVSLREYMSFLLAKRRSHKGENGKITLVGGSRALPGAITLAAQAAATLRSGADLVKVCAPEAAALSVNCLLPDVITKKIKGEYLSLDNLNEIVEEVNWSDAFLIGPGMSRRAETSSLAVKLSLLPAQKVIDADALRAVSLTGVSRVRNAMLTPHINELEALLINSEKNSRRLKGKITCIKRAIKKIQAPLVRRKIEKELSREVGAVVLSWGSLPILLGEEEALSINAVRPLLKENILLVKGHNDIVLSKEIIGVNLKGNKGMSVGGTGDILAGLTTGLEALAVSAGIKDPVRLGITLSRNFMVSLLSSYIMGVAGDSLKDSLGYSFIASDFFPAIAETIKNTGLS